MSPGMSGATVLKCQADDGRVFALKAYPEATPSRRLAEIHRVWQSAINRGCRWLPTIDAVFSAQRCTWEATTWIAGSPAMPDADESLIRQGARAIGDFHRCVADLGVSSVSPPAVAARLERLKQLDSVLPAAIAVSQPPPSPTVFDAIARANELLALKWPSASERLRNRLLEYANLKFHCQYVLRDVHREHVLFEGAETAGIIDLDAVRIDTPITDLARWVGDFLVDRPTQADRIWRAALAGLGEKNVLKTSLGVLPNDVVLKFAQTLHASTTWISLANWVVWVQLERRQFHAAAGVIAERILRLIRSASIEAADLKPFDASPAISLTWDSSQK